jgi:hypothetical protein
MYRQLFPLIIICYKPYYTIYTNRYIIKCIPFHKLHPFTVPSHLANLERVRGRPPSRKFIHCFLLKYGNHQQTLSFAQLTMYWPVGAPKIYAASNHELARAAKRDDKTDRPSETSESAVLPVDGADDGGGNTENGIAGSKKSGVRSSKKSRKSDASSKSVDLLALKRDEHVGGEIVGVRLGRNGHLFATITRCTLTIWQTKVSRHHPSFKL